MRISLALAASLNQPRRAVWYRSGACLLGLAALLAPFLAAGCAKAPAETREKKAPEVVISSAVPGQVIDYDDFTGRLDALKTVDIRAHVSGFATEAPFQEGDVVRKGDLLFRIDPRPFEASLNQAVANLKLAEADEALQARNASRARQMFASHSIGREEFEQVSATYEKSRATVGSMEAARDLAKLYVEYTRVTAPLAGRISRRLVDPGNLVNADQTVLTTVVSDRELYGYFDVDERTYLDLVQAVKSSAKGSWEKALKKFPVLMSLANEGDKFEHVGTVNFIDNRVSATTGTMRMRGVFDNADGVLRAGLFVRVRLPIGKPYQTLLLAAEALQSDQGRSYVFVLNDRDEVAYRPVTVGQEIKGLRVIKQGLTKDDRVIVSGQQRVREGVKVVAKVKPPPPAPELPLVRLLAANPPSGWAADHEVAGQGHRDKGVPDTRGGGTGRHGG